MHSHEKANNGKFVVHTVQLAPKLVVRSWEYHKMFTLTGNGEFVYSIPVKEMQILEVCLAKWWAHIGNIECSYSITFHGLTADRGASEITFHGAEGINRIELGSALNNEEVCQDSGPAIYLFVFSSINYQTSLTRRCNLKSSSSPWFKTFDLMNPRFRRWVTETLFRQTDMPTSYRHADITSTV